MEILLVDDDPRFPALLKRRMEGHTWRVARTRAEAVQALEDGAPDLVICDLRIPPGGSGGGAAHTDHGLAVFDAVRSRWPGVPVRVVSGFSDIDMLDERIRIAKGLAGHFKKDNLGALIAFVHEYQEEFAALGHVEISFGGAAVTLDERDRRLLQRYARERNATVVVARELGGGKSGAVALAVTLMEGLSSASHAVAKLNEIEEINDEHARYRAHIADRVDLAAYTPESECITTGAGSRGGLFYRLADGFDRSLLDVLAEDAADAADVVTRIQAATRRWRGTATAQRVSAAWVRQKLVPDEVRVALADEAPWDTLELEQLQLELICARQHGDLHGENVLVNSALQPILIDYGRAGFATACLDPITLEMSAALNPKGQLELAGWPSPAQAELWPDLEAFLQGCPIEPFVRACRKWSIDTARGDRELFATGFSYALRQLRYADVDHEIAAAMCLGGARAFLRCFD